VVEELENQKHGRDPDKAFVAKNIIRFIQRQQDQGLLIGQGIEERYMDDIDGKKVYLSNDRRDKGVVLCGLFFAKKYPSVSVVIVTEDRGLSFRSKSNVLPVKSVQELKKVMEEKER